MFSCWDAQFPKRENCKYTVPGVQQAIEQESKNQVTGTKSYN